MTSYFGCEFSVSQYYFNYNSSLFRGCIHKKSSLAIVRTKKTLDVFFVLSIFCVLPFLTYRSTLPNLYGKRRETSPPLPILLNAIMV
jgi:hypothetical protein